MSPSVLLALVPLAIVSNFVPWSGEGPGAAGRDRPTAIDVAPYAFAIWGVIFAGWLAYAVAQALPSGKNDPLMRRMRPPVSVLAVAAGLWPIVTSLREHVIGLALIVVMLASLIWIEVIAGAALASGSTQRQRHTWLVRVPFGLTLGWVSLATTLAGASVLLYDLGFDGGRVPAFAWSVMLIALLAGLGQIMLWARRNAAFAVAVTWGLVGIAASTHPAVIRTAALLGAAVTLVSLGAVWARSAGERRGPAHA